MDIDLYSQLSVLQTKFVHCAIVHLVFYIFQNSMNLFLLYII